MDANQIQNLFASNVRQLLVDADLDYDNYMRYVSAWEDLCSSLMMGRMFPPAKRYRTLSGYAGGS